MKKFRFRLQMVLNERKAAEDRLQTELGEIRRQEARELERLADLRGRFEEAQFSIMRGLQERARGDELERRDIYAKSLRDDAKVQELTLEAVRERAAAKLNELVEAMKARQVLETLRDKQESEGTDGMRQG